MKVALFDFCETLVDFQTADRYVEFVLSNMSPHPHYIYSKLLSFLQKKGIIWRASKLFPTVSLNKRLILKQICGVSESKLRQLAIDYYELELKPHFISKTIDELKMRQINGYRIVLLSGGYDIYLKCFAKEFGIEETDIISTKIKFKRGRCTGSFDGIDCQWNNKVKLLNRYYKKDALDSVAYSDSESDIPMLSWANEGIVIRRKGAPKWDKNNQFDEIIW